MLVELFYPAVSATFMALIVWRAAPPDAPRRERILAWALLTLFAQFLALVAPSAIY